LDNEDNWAILMTNNDRDEEQKDDRGRRKIGLQHLKALGRNSIDAGGIMHNVLQQLPNFVGNTTFLDHTVFCAVMQTQKK